jgi:hypothetical protein
MAATVEESTPPDIATAIVPVFSIKTLLAFGLWLLAWHLYSDALSQEPKAKS